MVKQRDNLLQRNLFDYLTILTAAQYIYIYLFIQGSNQPTEVEGTTWSVDVNFQRGSVVT